MEAAADLLTRVQSAEYTGGAVALWGISQPPPPEGAPNAWWAASSLDLGPNTARDYAAAAEEAFDSIKKGMAILGVKNWEYNTSTLVAFAGDELATEGAAMGDVALGFVKGVDKLAGAFYDLGLQAQGTDSAALKPVAALMKLEACLLCCTVDAMRDLKGQPTCERDCSSGTSATDKSYGLYWANQMERCFK